MVIIELFTWWFWRASSVMQVSDASPVQFPWMAHRSALLLAGLLAHDRRQPRSPFAVLLIINPSAKKNLPLLLVCGVGVGVCTRSIPIHSPSLFFTYYLLFTISPTTTSIPSFCFLSLATLPCRRRLFVSSSLPCPPAPYQIPTTYTSTLHMTLTSPLLCLRPLLIYSR